MLEIVSFSEGADEVEVACFAEGMLAGDGRRDGEACRGAGDEVGVVLAALEGLDGGVVDVLALADAAVVVAVFAGAVDVVVLAGVGVVAVFDGAVFCDVAGF
jgi:hypothetical protein